MCGSKPKTPKPQPVIPAPTPPAITPPIEADTSARTAGDEERRRRRAATGVGDTILTGGLGLSEGPSVGGKKLKLGQ